MVISSEFTYNLLVNSILPSHNDLIHLMEYPSLQCILISPSHYRIFSHPNVLPLVGCCNHPPNLVVITQYLPYGSLFTLLHQDSGIVVDTAQALKFALDIARGMAFIHSLDKLVPNLYLSSKHVMVRLCKCSSSLEKW